MNKIFTVLLVWALACGQSAAQGRQDAYTFIGELHYNKNTYLNYREITNIPYVFFSGKYMLVCASAEGGARIRDTVFPKELYYDRQSQAVEVRFSIPKTAFANSRTSIALLGRIIRRSDDAIVGAIKDPIVLRIPDVSDPAYINSTTFKLSNPIKVGAPAEVSVATIVDYLREKLTLSTDTNDFPRIVKSLTSGRTGPVAVRDYYRLIEFIEPYITNDAFLTREAAELHDSLVLLRDAMTNATVVPGAKQQARYRESKWVYEDYCRFYVDLKRYYIEAYKKIQGGTPIWFEIGSNFRQDDGLSLNGLYGGVFAHTRPKNFAYPYKGPRLDIFRIDTTLNPAQYGLGDKRSRRPGFSLFAGLYSASAVGTSSQDPFAREYYTVNSPDSLTTFGPFKGRFKDSGTVTFSQHMQYVTLLLSPRIDLLRRTKSRSATRLELGLHTELQFQRYTYHKDLSVVKRTDTTFVRQDLIGDSFGDSTSTLLDKTEDVLAWYVGLELPLEFSNRTFDFLITPVIGFTNQIPIQGAQPVNDNNFRPFFSTRATLNEKYLGIGLTGEVKLPLSGEGSPFVSLALIKKINARTFLRNALLLGE